jgi:hypothetical protein
MTSALGPVVSYWDFSGPKVLVAHWVGSDWPKVSKVYKTTLNYPTIRLGLVRWAGSLGL